MSKYKGHPKYTDKDKYHAINIMSQNLKANCEEPEPLYYKCSRIVKINPDTLRRWWKDFKNNHKGEIEQKRKETESHIFSIMEQKKIELANEMMKEIPEIMNTFRLSREKANECFNRGDTRSALQAITSFGILYDKIMEIMGQPMRTQPMEILSQESSIDELKQIINTAISEKAEDNRKGGDGH